MTSYIMFSHWMSFVNFLIFIMYFQSLKLSLNNFLGFILPGKIVQTNTIGTFFGSRDGWKVFSVGLNPNKNYFLNCYFWDYEYDFRFCHLWFQKIRTFWIRIQNEYGLLLNVFHNHENLLSKNSGGIILQKRFFSRTKYTVGHPFVERVCWILTRSKCLFWVDDDDNKWPIIFSKNDFKKKK